MLAQESPMMAKANTTIEVMEMSPKEKWLYENRMKYEHDKASWKHVGYQEGILQGETKGRQEGFADGARQNKLETAAAFKRMGISIKKIAEGTGLTEEEIKNL